MAMATDMAPEFRVVRLPLTIVAGRDKGLLKKRRLLAVLVCLAVSANAHAQAQDQTQGPAPDGLTPDAAMSPSIVTPSATTQSSDVTDVNGAAPHRAWIISPRIAVKETFTTNATPGQGSAKSDQITEITPGIHVAADTARLKLNLDYGLSQILYAQGSRGDKTQNALNAFGTFQAVEQFLFLDFGGTIAQQDVSAFRTQTSSNVLGNANRVETSNFHASPYIKGRLGGYVNYELRYNFSTTTNKGGAIPGSDISTWSGNLGGDTGLANLSWSADADDTSIEYASGRKSNSNHLRGLLAYKVDPQFKVSVSAGTESNDYVSVNETRTSTSGIGFDWTPTERTQVSVFKERRFFGDGHTINIVHRMPLSSIQYSDSKTVAVLPNTFATVGLGTFYDLLLSQVAAQNPTQTAAQQAAEATLILNLLGIPLNAQITGGFLSQQASVARNQNLSYVITGARNTLAFALTQTQNDRLGAALTGDASDFSVTSSIRQKGFSINWSHTLSALSSFNVIAARQMSSSGNSVLPSTSSHSITAQLTTKLGVHTNGGISIRRSEFNGTANPYTENAVIASANMQF